jgi:hypothetical protein
MKSLAEYIKNVRAVQWIISVIPLGGRLLSGQSALAFPALGDDTGSFVFLAVVLSGVAAILPWAIPLRRGRTILMLCSVLLLFCSAIAYYHLSQRYVVSIPTGNGGKMTVSIGSVRTAFANQTYPGKSDAEMLMSRGPYENEVKKLWTSDSIDCVRDRLFGTYLFVFMLLNFVVGLFAQIGSFGRAPEHLPTS